MKKQLITTSIILAMATTPVMAATTNSINSIEHEVTSDGASEIIGFSTGAIIGGIIAGPIGVVAAGTIGIILGQSHDRLEQVEIAEARLEKNKLVMQSLSNEKQRLASQLSATEEKQLQLTEKLAMTENTLNQADKLAQLKLNLRFDVDSAQVESFYKPQINHLAMMMQDNPELSVNLSGFSDASGGKENNLKLSQARIESVKSMLVNQGVDEQYIHTQAFGESSSQQTKRTANTDFNDRRVDVALFSQEQVVSTEHALTLEASSQKQDVDKNSAFTQEQVIAQEQIIADLN